MGKQAARPLDDNTLFAFVVDANERTHDWPTVQHVAQHFGVTPARVADAIRDFDTDEGRGVDLIAGDKVEAWDDGDEENTSR